MPVPGWIDLSDHSEIVVQDYAPPARATAVARRTSRSANAVGSALAFVYGHDSLLYAPTHLALDSRKRLIVTDAALSAVHVLGGDRSFRIVGGVGHRFQQPHGVAVDSHDNIHVADRKAGLIFVYDNAGVFLHAIGTFKGESIFQEPTGIAIADDHLYVLDSPVHELVVLDLDGNVLQRAGGRHHKAGVSFESPSEIVVRDSTVVVLDFFGARVQVFDLKFHLLSAFWTGNIPSEAKLTPMGLGVDRGGNVYVSNDLPGLRIYSQSGVPVGSLNNCGQSTPGIFIDSASHMYVADPALSRVNVFQQFPAAEERNPITNSPQSGPEAKGSQ